MTKKQKQSKKTTTPGARTGRGSNQRKAKATPQTAERAPRRGAAAKPPAPPPPPPVLPNGEDDTPDTDDTDDADADGSDDEAGDEDDGGGERDSEGEGDGDGDDGEAQAQVNPRVAAATRIGHSIHAHLEVLYLTDPNDAIETLEKIVPVLADLSELAEDFATLGSPDLARDVRLAVDRQDQQRQRHQR